MSKGKIAVIATISVVVLLIIIMITSLPIWDKDNGSQTVTDIPRMEQDEQFTIEDMTTFVEDDYKGEDGIRVDDKKNITDLLKQRLKDKKSVYDNENDTIIKQLQKEIDKEKDNPVTVQPSTQINPSTQVRTVNNQVKRELSYAEKLKKARAAKFNSSSSSTSSKKEVYIPSIETKVAVFKDQFVLPSDLVELVLTKDFNFDGKTFKKGTLLYADISIDQNRVLFDIPNIAHVPLTLEVRDIRDGRVGMRSKRAGELWQQYERESSDSAQDDVSNAIETGTKSRVIGNSIRALSTFFKRKKLKKSEKIWLLNDQQLILKVTPTEL